MTAMSSQTYAEQETSNPNESKNSSSESRSSSSSVGQKSQPADSSSNETANQQTTSSIIDNQPTDQSNSSNARRFSTASSLLAVGLTSNSGEQLTSSTGSVNCRTSLLNCDLSNNLSNGNALGLSNDCTLSGLSASHSVSNSVSNPSTDNLLNSVTNSFASQPMIVDSDQHLSNCNEQTNKSHSAASNLDHNLGIMTSNMTKKPSDLLDAACQAIHSDLEDNSFGENFCIEIAQSAEIAGSSNHHCDLSEIVNNHILNDDLLLDDHSDRIISENLSDCDLNLLLSVNEHQATSRNGDSRTTSKFNYNLVSTLNGSLDSSLNGSLSGGALSNGGQMLNSELSSSSSLFNSVLSSDSSYGASSLSHGGLLTSGGPSQSASPYGASPGGLASPGRSSTAPNAVNSSPLLTNEENPASHSSNSLKKSRTSNVHLSYLLQTKPQHLPPSNHQLQKQLHARKLLTTDANPFG